MAKKSYSVLNDPNISDKDLVDILSKDVFSTILDFIENQNVVGVKLYTDIDVSDNVKEVFNKHSFVFKSKEKKADMLEEMLEEVRLHEEEFEYSFEANSQSYLLEYKIKEKLSEILNLFAERKQKAKVKRRKRL